MFQNGEIMKKHPAVLLTLICLLGLGLSARAQEQGAVVTNVPFEFVAGGKVLPAGKYTVNRVAPASGSRELEMRSYEMRASVFVIPTAFDELRSQKAQFTFEHLGNGYFLSAIETATGTYSIDIRPSAIKLIQMEQHGPSPSGSN
jgi:hypothetical protein